MLHRPLRAEKFDEQRDDASVSFVYEVGREWFRPGIIVRRRTS